jgi:1-phosphofructokinase family hexose kinase
VILCVAATPSIDKLMTVDRVEIGAIHRQQRLVNVAGGKCLNVGRAAHALGAQVKIVPMLAGHAGAWLHEQLLREGIDTYPVWVGGETRSCLSVSDGGRTALTEFYESVPRLDEDDWARFVSEVRRLLPHASWVVIAGSSPPGIAAPAYAEVIALAGNAETALDTTGSALTHGIAAGPSLIKVNRLEAASALGIDAAELDPAEAAFAIAGQSSRRTVTVIVTDGTAGAYCRFADGTALHGTLGIEGPYPVGSGDSFLAGIVSAREDGANWVDALALGLATAAANAETPGAGRFKRSRAIELAARVEIQEIGEPGGRATISPVSSDDPDEHHVDGKH